MLQFQPSMFDDEVGRVATNKHTQHVTAASNKQEMVKTSRYTMFYF